MDFLIVHFLKNGHQNEKLEHAEVLKTHIKQHIGVQAFERTKSLIVKKYKHGNLDCPEIEKWKS